MLVLPARRDRNASSHCEAAFAAGGYVAGESLRNGLGPDVSDLQGMKSVADDFLDNLQYGKRARPKRPEGNAISCGICLDEGVVHYPMHPPTSGYVWYTARCVCNAPRKGHTLDGRPAPWSNRIPRFTDLQMGMDEVFNINQQAQYDHEQYLKTHVGKETN